eukprot:6131506-Pyramimonas_sp.AAC.4
MNGTQVGCQSGNRSKGAATALSAAGYEVFEVNGGYSAWARASSPQLPVTGGPLFRIVRTGGARPHDVLPAAPDGFLILFYSRWTQTARVGRRDPLAKPQLVSATG